MTQDFEINKKRIERLGLTCSLIDNSGKVRHFQDGYEYVEIGGLKWTIKNVGAEKETDSGLYFQWGDIQGYTADQVSCGEKRFSWRDYKYGFNTTMTKYNSIDGKTVLEPSDDAARFHMGGSWRMPTEEDFHTLLANTTKKWAKVNGVKGRLFTSKTDSSKTLFFPACGLCHFGSVDNVDFFGNYWSSPLGTLFTCSRVLSFGISFCGTSSNDRRFGFSVRSVAD